MFDEVAPNGIGFPIDAAGKEEIGSEFKRICGFPNVLGCIDASYIAVRTPKHKIRSTYINRHDSISITMQGICDANLRFLDVFTGVPSKMHDSRLLKLSFIGKELGKLCSPDLLGDSAYPLRTYLLTPYRDYGNLTETERKYNYKFFQTRVKIENAFGLLKCRFRQIMRLDFHVEPMGKFIVACINKNYIFEEQLEYIEHSSNQTHILAEDVNEAVLSTGQLAHCRAVTPKRNSSGCQATTTPPNNNNKATPLRVPHSSDNIGCHSSSRSTQQQQQRPVTTGPIPLACRNKNNCCHSKNNNHQKRRQQPATTTTAVPHQGLLQQRSMKYNIFTDYRQTESYY
ncbi:PREDICTED: putative nuclease HARBI1 [Rhagoletis zephyria]|uniref:putative nuclease HARBI1 n=1 Tax=Rhagoletis zephyria TaxID=28612 RepID=UPI0008118BEE|nr:PREDICTED: putative nuclease HARBI1 [Rhagoletis zephyria]